MNSRTANDFRRCGNCAPEIHLPSGNHNRSSSRPRYPLQDKCRMSGTAPRRKDAEVTDPIADQRHSVGVQFGDQNRRLCPVSLGLDQRPRPVHLVVEVHLWVTLDGNRAKVATAVAFVDRLQVSERFSNQVAVRRVQFFCAGHEAYPWVVPRPNPVLHQKLGELRQGRRVGGDAVGRPSFPFFVIRTQHVRGQTKAVEPSDICRECTGPIAKAVAGLRIEMVPPQVSHLRSGGHADAFEGDLLPAFVPAAFFRSQPDFRRNPG